MDARGAAEFAGLLSEWNRSANGALILRLSISAHLRVSK